MKRRIARAIRTTTVFSLIFTALLLVVSGIMVQAQAPSFSAERVAKVVASPDSFYGAQVSLRSTVEAIVGVNAFVIDNPGITGGKILVAGSYSSDGKATLVRVNDKLEIRGRVQTFDIKKVEKEVNTDLPEDIFANWQGRPVIIAESITK